MAGWLAGCLGDWWLAGWLGGCWLAGWLPGCCLPDTDNTDDDDGAHDDGGGDGDSEMDWGGERNLHIFSYDNPSLPHFHSALFCNPLSPTTAGRIPPRRADRHASIRYSPSARRLGLSCSGASTLAVTATSRTLPQQRRLGLSR